MVKRTLECFRLKASLWRFRRLGIVSGIVRRARHARARENHLKEKRGCPRFLEQGAKTQRNLRGESYLKHVRARNRPSGKEATRRAQDEFFFYPSCQNWSTRTGRFTKCNNLKQVFHLRLLYAGSLKPTTRGSRYNPPIADSELRALMAIQRAQISE